MVIAFSVLLISIIGSGAWLYQVLSVAQTMELTKDGYETHFPTLIITEDTILTEDHSGEIIIEADNVTLDGNGHTITGPGAWGWNSTMRMWVPVTGISINWRAGVIVKNCRVTNFAYGLTLDMSDYCTLMNNTVYGNVWSGISVTFSLNNNILANTVYDTRDVDTYNFDASGFAVEMSFGNVFEGNKAYDNGRGFSIGEFESEIFEEYRGFIPEEYKGNIFEGNTVESNTEAGFWIGTPLEPPPFKNIFFHNNLIGNAIQAFLYRDYGYPNKWDDDYPSGGNYWSNYEGVDADGDGIGDTPYEIPTFYYEWDEDDEDPNPIPSEPDGNNVDRYPLMTPFSD
jgi:parallel beta-helix repeat protein